MSSQTARYRGSRDFIICQAGDGAGRICRHPVRHTGAGKIGPRVVRLYRCELGHKFAIGTDFGLNVGWDGELDDGFEYRHVSGESGAGRSGESGDSLTSQQIRETPQLRDQWLDGFYSDRRKVTLIPSEPVVFGRPWEA